MSPGASKSDVCSCRANPEPMLFSLSETRPPLQAFPAEGWVNSRKFKDQRGYPLVAARLETTRSRSRPAQFGKFSNAGVAAQAAVTRRLHRLQQLDLPVEQIGYGLSFRDPAYFSRFRKYQDTSPRTYRRRARLDGVKPSPLCRVAMTAPAACVDTGPFHGDAVNGAEKSARLGAVVIRTLAARN